MLPDRDKTKEQPKGRLTKLRRQVDGLETLEKGLEWAEETLRDSEEKYRYLFNELNDAVFLADAETGHILDTNKQGEVLLGRTREDIIGMHQSKLHPPEMADEYRQRFVTHIEKGHSADYDGEVIRKDGSIVPVNIRAAPITIGGKPLILGLFRDITERKRVEETLRLQAEIMANLSEAVYIIRTSDGVIVYTNPKFEEMFGYEPGEMVGKHVSIVNAPTEKSPEETAKEIIEFINKTGGWRGEIQNIKKDGTLFWSYASVSVFDHPEHGEIWITVHTDITERKQAEEALRESEERYRALVNLGGRVGEAIIMLQDTQQGDAIQTFVSNEWLHITGYTRKELLGMSFFDILHPKYQQISLGRHRRKMKGEIIPGFFEMSIIKKDGTEVPIELTSAYTTYKGERANVAFIRDITERKGVEETLRIKENAIASSINAIVIADLEGNLTYVNDSFLKMWGYENDNEVLGKQAVEFWQSEEKASQVVEVLKEGGGWVGELVAKRKDGSFFNTQLSTSIVMDETGKPICRMASFMDITERKQAEEREKRLQRELLLSSRLASIGELAAGVAHQINNPLTGVIGFSQRLLKKSTDEEAKRDLARVCSEAQRAAKIVESLLVFARHRGPEREYVDINDILGRTVELRAYELRTSNIDLAVELAPDLPRTMANFHQIQEVFLNLILNVEQAMIEAKRGGELSIKTQQVNNRIRISFADNGPGIPSENLNKVFDPFFTTRGDRGGTGLGLSVCYGIVTDHGGSIYAQSKPGKGSTFFVELPVVPQKG